MSRVFPNSLGGQGSIPGWVIAKTQKMVLDAALLKTQHYKVKIKGKVEQSKEWSSALPYTVAIEKGAFRSPSTKVANFTYIMAANFSSLSSYLIMIFSLSHFYLQKYQSKIILNVISKKSCTVAIKPLINLRDSTKKNYCTWYSKDSINYGRHPIVI